LARATPYNPVKVESNGRGTASATVTLGTPSTGNSFVVVHASADNLAAVVACGNLAPPTR
jgi:hypothetical protein